MAESEDVQIGKKLHDWAYQEMNFPPLEQDNAVLPTDEDFKGICKGPFNDVWKFVLENVYSAVTVKKIKGNLALKETESQDSHNASKYSEELQQLQQEKARLSEELSAVIAENKMMEADHEKVQQELLDVERSLQCNIRSIQDTRRKTMMLKSFSQKGAIEAAQCEEFSKRLTVKAEQMRTKTREKSTGEVYLARETSAERRGSETAIETECCKSVRESCASIAHFLKDVLDGNFQNDAATFNQRKDDLWKSVETVLSEYRIGRIIQSMMINTQESAIDIREKTESINVRKDAEKLQFKYENSGELVDMSSNDTDLRSIQELQEDCQAEHLERFFETEQNKNESWKLNQQIEAIKSKIDEIVQKQTMGRPEDLGLARQYVEAKLDLAGAEAMQESCQEKVETLKTSIEQATKQCKALKEKHEKIEAFKETADKKQQMIHVLVKQNINSAAHMASKRSEIVDYVEKSVLGHKDEIVSVIQGSQGGIQREAEMFSELSMPYLLHTNLDSTTKVSALDMLLHQVDRGDNTLAGRNLLETMNALKFPLYKAPEHLLLRCVEVKCEVDELESLLHYHNLHIQRLALQMKDNKDPAICLTELCEKMKDCDQCQLDNVLPKLTVSVNKAKATLNSSETLQDTIKGCVEQPAQYTIPWVKLDDLNIQQWIDRWTILATKVRQEAKDEGSPL